MYIPSELDRTLPVSWVGVLSGLAGWFAVNRWSRAGAVPLRSDRPASAPEPTWE